MSVKAEQQDRDAVDVFDPDSGYMDHAGSHLLSPTEGAELHAIGRVAGRNRVLEILRHKDTARALANLFHEDPPPPAYLVELLARLVESIEGQS